MHVKRVEVGTRKFVQSDASGLFGGLIDVPQKIQPLREHSALGVSTPPTGVRDGLLKVYFVRRLHRGNCARISRPSFRQ